MKAYNETNVLDIIEQIRNLNHLIDIHKLENDDLMLNQYKSKKKDFINDLIYELMSLNINSKDLYSFIRKKLNQLEENIEETEVRSQKKLSFSFKELDEITVL